MSLSATNGPDCCVWEITRACNFRCKHCGVAAGEPRQNELSKEEALSLCDELSEIGSRGLSLLGGEIFLRPDWHDISKRIRDNSMTLSLISNGWVINQELMQKISRLDCKCFTVSLDGSKQIHDEVRREGSFERCMNAIDLSIQNGVPTSVITTLTKKNLGELEKLRDILETKDLAWQIQLATPHGERMEDSDMLTQEQFFEAAKFIDKTRKGGGILVSGAHDFGYYSDTMDVNCFYGNEWRGCPAGTGVLGIQSNGNVKGCLSLPDEFVEGNVRDEGGLEKIWNSGTSFGYNRKFKKENLKGPCKDCEFGEICRGGCTDVSYSSSGEINNNVYCVRLMEGVSNGKSSGQGDR